MAHGLYLDLAVGTHPSGAETWANELNFARAVSIGSPPDAFSAQGQNWGLAPLNPLALHQQRYAPFVQTLRAQLRYSGMLRIDHALGLERSFWIPDGAVTGAYVAMPRDALLAILRIEASRADAVIIGEDLGNIPDGLRTALASSGILGCRVAMFERNWKTDRAFIDAKDYSIHALASLSTHDLPTMVGWTKGRDIDWREKIADISPEQAKTQHQERQSDIKAFGQPTTAAAHDFLARTASVLVAAQLEDILELVEQPNLPGTIHQHPNWRRTLPLTIAQIDQLPAMRTLANTMAKQNRA